MTSIVRIIIIFIAAIALPNSGQAGQEQTSTSQRLLFGIVPQQSATRLAKIWVPMMNDMSAKTGLNIHFTTAKDIPTFEKCLSAGAYDLAYMNPYHYVEFSKHPGYRAFAHQRGKKLRGIMVVKKDSTIKDFEPLRGAKLAFPSPAAFGASVLPRAEMSRQGIDFEPVYVKSHDSVYKVVAAGLYPAGGGVLRTFNSIPEGLRAQLRIFYETEAYTPHAFAAHPGVAQTDIEKVAGYLAGIDPASPLLKPLGMKGIDRATDENWNDVRALGLTRKQTEIVEGNPVCRSD